ncbi:hypothetical protein PCE1_003653 [Barthelona sp. PCE]
MGAEASVLTNDEISQLQAESELSAEEIEKLWNSFSVLDKDASGGLTGDEFLQIPNFSMNPLRQRLLSLLDKNHDESVDFEEFVRVFSIFSPRADPEDKLRFCFSVYDVDNDGYISNGELFQVLKMMVGNNLGDIELQQMVDKTIELADTQNVGKVCYEDFCNLLQRVPNKVTTVVTEKMEVRL